MLACITILTISFAATTPQNPYALANKDLIGRYAEAALVQLRDCPPHTQSFYAADVAGLAHLAGRGKVADEALALAVKARQATELKSMATQKLILGYAMTGNPLRCRAMITEMERPSDRIMGACQAGFAMCYYRRDHKAAGAFIDLALSTYEGLDEEQRSGSLAPLATLLSAAGRFERARTLIGKHPDEAERIDSLYITARAAAMLGKARLAKQLLAEADQATFRKMEEDALYNRPSLFRVMALAEMGESGRALDEYRTIDDEGWREATMPFLALAQTHGNERELAIKSVRKTERMLADNDNHGAVAYTMGLLALVQAHNLEPKELDAWIDRQERPEVKAAMYASVAGSYYYQQYRRSFRRQNEGAPRPKD